MCADLTINLKKLRSKDVAMRTHLISVYYKYTEIAWNFPSNEKCERLTTRMARLRASVASLLEESSCQAVKLTNSPRYSN